MSSDAVEPLADHREAEVLARVARLEVRVDDLDQLFPLPDASPAPVAADQDEVRLGEWVETFLAVTFTRSLGGEHRWCARWAEHPEAVLRLRALREALVVLRSDSPIGEAIWLRDHLDPQLAVLLSARGPFALCSQNRHDRLPPLPVI